MCGRYYRQADKQRIAQAMHAEVPFAGFPSYNIAPQTMQPVIRLDRETGNRQAAMMVILSPADYGRWLDPRDPARPPIDLLRPLPAEEVTCWQVGKDVGNVRNDRPDLIDPVPRELGLFAS